MIYYNEPVTFFQTPNSTNLRIYFNTKLLVFFIQAGGDDVLFFYLEAILS